jgi:hypothetical protein
VRNSLWENGSRFGISIIQEEHSSRKRQEICSMMFVASRRGTSATKKRTKLKKGATKNIFDNDDRRYELFDAGT